VAVPIGEEQLAVNRSRPNAFTIDNWRRALDAETLVKPHTGSDQMLVSVADAPGAGAFHCANDLCVARHMSGKVVAQAKSESAARPACKLAAVIVVDDATASDPCHLPSVAVITKRQLAKAGSAAVFFSDQSYDTRAQVRYAVEAHYRPWHMQRRFSREARGLGPYEKKDRKPTDGPKPEQSAED
jgi:competence protein ComEC